MDLGKKSPSASRERKAGELPERQPRETGNRRRGKKKRTSAFLVGTQPCFITGARKEFGEKAP